MGDDKELRVGEGQATPPEVLHEQLMDVSRPATEIEHYARKRIKGLEQQVLQYGDHMPTCLTMCSRVPEQCSCGFDAIVDEIGFPDD